MSRLPVTSLLLLFDLDLPSLYPRLLCFLAVTPSQPHGEYGEKCDGWSFCDGSQSGTFPHGENECDVVTGKIWKYGKIS
jgi:hypothetical protein